MKWYFKYTPLSIIAFPVFKLNCWWSSIPVTNYDDLIYRQIFEKSEEEVFKELDNSLKDLYLEKIK